MKAWWRDRLGVNWAELIQWGIVVSVIIALLVFGD